MNLIINSEVVSRAPDENIIREHLSGLNIDRDGEGFAILEQAEMTYMQVSGDPQRGFDAEYQEGDINNHFRAEKESFTLEEIISMMTEYLYGEINWDKYGKWSKITW